MKRIRWTRRTVNNPVHYKNRLKVKWVLIPIIMLCLIVLFYSLINSKNITLAEAEQNKPRYATFIIFGDIDTVADIWKHHSNANWSVFLYEVEKANPDIDFGKLYEGQEVLVPRELVE